MKRSMIAVCLLLLLPGTVVACFEDHNAGVGWFDVQSPRYAGFGNGGHAMLNERMVEMSLIAGGAGVLILFCVLGRGMFQAARRREISPFDEPFEESEPVPLAVPFDEPPWDPNCEWSPDELDEGGWSAPEMVGRSELVLSPSSPGV